MRICWEVLKEDIVSAAHILGEIIVLMAGLICALLAFVAPAIALNHFTEELIHPIEGLFISAFTWFWVYVIAIMVYDGVKAAVDRYTNVWSDCGEHGSQSAVSCEAD